MAVEWRNNMQLTGAQIVIECLKEQGVDTVFGYPGGAILNVYDELYKHQGEIRQDVYKRQKLWNGYKLYFFTGRIVR